MISEAHYGLPEVFGVGRRDGSSPTPAATRRRRSWRSRRSCGGWEGSISSITVNALSGVSGAGAKPSVKTGFVSANENANAYGAPRHRHTPEIETMLRRVGESPEVTFVPHLIPVTRGELETIVVDVEELPEAREVLGWYAEDYGEMEVRGGAARVSARRARRQHQPVPALGGGGRRAGKLLLFSALDNLLKGASGAAVQNMNLALGYPEDLGLEHLK